MKKNKIAFLLMLVPITVFAADKPEKKETPAWKRLIQQDKAPATNVAGVRGLQETEAGLDTQARDYAAIDKLEEETVSEDKVDEFVQEGGLK